MIRQSKEYVGLRYIIFSVANVFLGADFPSIRIFTFSHHHSLTTFKLRSTIDPLVCNWSDMADNQAEMSGCEDSLEPQSGPPSRRSRRAVSLLAPGQHCSNASADYGRSAMPVISAR